MSGPAIATWVALFPGGQGVDGPDMRVLVFTAIIMGVACLALGYGLAGVSLRLKAQREAPRVLETVEAETFPRGDPLPAMIATLPIKEREALPLKRRVGALKRLYHRQPALAVERLAALIEDPAARALERLYEREQRPAWRHLLLKALWRQGLDSGKSYLRRIASNEKLLDRSFARKILEKSEPGTLSRVEALPGR